MVLPRVRIGSTGAYGFKNTDLWGDLVIRLWMMLLVPARMQALSQGGRADKEPLASHRIANLCHPRLCCAPRLTLQSSQYYNAYYHYAYYYYYDYMIPVIGFLSLYDSYHYAYYYDYIIPIIGFLSLL